MARCGKMADSGDLSRDMYCTEHGLVNLLKRMSINRSLQPEGRIFYKNEAVPQSAGCPHWKPKSKVVDIDGGDSS